MASDLPFPLYDSREFREKFMHPAPALAQMLQAQAERFFITRLEDFYRFVRQAVPPMRSAAHHCLFITSGEARMAIGYDRYTVRQNELLFVPAGQVLSFQPGEINTGYLGYFHPDWLLRGARPGERASEYEFLTMWGQPLVQFEAGVAGFVQRLLDRILVAYQQEGLGAADLLQAYLLALLAEAKRGHQPQPVPAASAALTLATAFKRLVSTHVTQTHQVAAYAEWLHVTPNHLNKAVKAATGKSPTAWLDEALVLEAKVLLCQTNQSIATIAAQVGVGDASYFSRLFKKVEGRRPSELRQLLATVPPAG